MTTTSLGAIDLCGTQLYIHRFDGVGRLKLISTQLSDMRTGERRLAARAWVGAASSARANAHRAAAILSVYNESFAMAYSNSDAQR